MFLKKSTFKKNILLPVFVMVLLMALSGCGGNDTVAEKVGNYTDANGYHALYGTYNIYFNFPVARGIGRIWLASEREDHYVIVQGNTFSEFVGNEDGMYDLAGNKDDGENSTGVTGIIIECSDTNQASGIMYVRVLRSMAHTPLEFAAVAWRAKSQSSIEIATGSENFGSLEEAKAEYGAPSDFTDNDFSLYEK